MQDSHAIDWATSLASLGATLLISQGTNQPPVSKVAKWQAEGAKELCQGVQLPKV